MLLTGIRAAAAGSRHVDPIVAADLPRPGAPPLRDALFHDEISRSVWRAMALGVRGTKAIAEVAAYSDRSVRDCLGLMAQRLRELDPGLDPYAKPYETLVGFASSYWEFLLDDTVMRLFPPAIARGLRRGSAP
jgi:hypothetical protein